MTNNKRIALFPGSFDPFTVGHESIVKRTLPLFDEIIIGIGVNSEKNSLLKPEKRQELIKKVFCNETKISIKIYSELTIKFCKTNNCNFILRGIRNYADFEYEQTLAHANRLLDSSIETVIVFTLPEFACVSSSVVRDIIKYKADSSHFLPKNINIEDYLF